MIARNGWTELGEPIADLGRSAWKGVHLTKGNLGKFAERVRNGEVARNTILVVEDLDRLSRQEPRVTQRWLEDMTDLGIRFAVVSNNKVYDQESLKASLFETFEILMRGNAAWEYAERLAGRVRASYKARLEKARTNNTKITTVCPAWMRAVGERPNVQFAFIEERVEVVREIFDLTLAGHAPWAIARMFNERTPPCPSFTGIKWERTSIVKIIRNRAIEGDYVVGEGKASKPTGEVLVGYYPRAVEADMVAQARAMLDRRRRGKGRNSGAINNLFGQKIRCGVCKGRMMQVGYQSRYLTCYEANRGNGCGHRTTYKYRPFEAAALSEILHLALDETFFREAAKTNALALDIANAEKAVRDKEEYMVMLKTMLGDRKSRTIFETILLTEGELNDLKANVADLKHQLTQAQGVASAEAHLRRVHGVREALSHPDDSVRLPARLRVSEALQAAVDWVDCKTGPHGKRIYMGLIGGAHSSWFDNEGNLLSGLPSRSPESAAAGFRASAAPCAAFRVALPIHGQIRNCQIASAASAAMIPIPFCMFAPLPT